eukprot:2355996-Pleurochrysis_carterae.AAC.1
MSPLSWSFCLLPPFASSCVGLVACATSSTAVEAAAAARARINLVGPIAAGNPHPPSQPCRA